MGFFSWQCRECGHSILSPYAINQINGWMSDAVVVEAKGNILKGTYDGYGRIDGRDIEYDFDNAEPDMYHEACWKLAGKPTDYKGGSESADDQGYFFDNEHDVQEPKTPTDVATITAN